MLRFCLRMAGYLLTAAAFVLLVLDGARAIANGALRLTSLAEVAEAVLGPRFAAFREGLARSLPPALLDAALGALALPAIAPGFVLGFLLLWLGQPRRPGIGVLTGR